MNSTAEHQFTPGPGEDYKRLKQINAELLEALELLMALTSPGGHFLYVKEHGLPMTNGDVDIIDKALIAAEAAIKKAKGDANEL